jgi:hypothetical protein
LSRDRIASRRVGLRPSTAFALLAAFTLPASQAAVTLGALDGSTGLQWAYASSVSEGQSQGHRTATADDFQALLRDAGLTATASQGSAYAQGEFGFGPPMDGQGNGRLGSLTFPAGSILGTAVQKALPAPTPDSSTLGFAFGWLGGVPGQLGAVGHCDDFRTLACTGGAVCATVMQTRANGLAGWGSVDQLMAGQHSTLGSPVDGGTPWSQGLVA